MNTVTVRNVEIGAGMPKICVPIVGENRESILEQARTIKTLPADLVEWRVDYLNNVSSLSLLTVLTFLSELRNELGDTPLVRKYHRASVGLRLSVSLWSVPLDFGKNYRKQQLYKVCMCDFF